MNPINSFDHKNSLYQLQVFLQNDTLVLSLAGKASPQKWKKIYSYDLLPTALN